MLTLYADERISSTRETPISKGRSRWTRWAISKAAPPGE
jgi:hypothetical protein